MADPENKNDGTTLYVANLGYRCVDEDLEERFNVFGEISSMELMKDPVTRESRGFAFITYRDSQDAKDAQRKMDGANKMDEVCELNFREGREGSGGGYGRDYNRRSYDYSRDRDYDDRGRDYDDRRGRY
eukprot:CAMPEP_0117850426 /NCGR_PEP_ID=MMETSP0949-20121206/21680_1 /TAXON_ID=44440 /ORGANISM="Chattonella subsalsa, Strain CCMP2191" /LENGTH=128 /DNA_ID=CAMNT_0005697817 /DNA_START=322 /DNA_END=709 /DNA_ORIENTATION=+